MKWIRWTVIVFALFLVVIVSAFLVGVRISLQPLASSIDDSVAAAVDMPFTFGRGELETGTTLKFRFEDLRFGTADRPFATVRNVDIVLPLRAVFQGHWQLREILIDSVTINADAWPSASAAGSMAESDNESTWVLPNATKITNTELHLQGEVYRLVQLNTTFDGRQVFGDYVVEALGERFSGHAVVSIPDDPSVLGGLSGEFALSGFDSEVRGQIGIQQESGRAFQLALDAAPRLWSWMPYFEAGPDQVAVSGQLLGMWPLVVADWQLETHNQPSGVSQSAAGARFSLRGDAIVAAEVSAHDYVVDIMELERWFSGPDSANDTGWPTTWPVEIVAGLGVGVVTWGSITFALQSLQGRMFGDHLEAKIAATVRHGEGHGVVSGETALVLGDDCPGIDLDLEVASWRPAFRLEGLDIEQVGQLTLRHQGCLFDWFDVTAMPLGNLHATNVFLGVTDADGDRSEVQVTELRLVSSAHQVHAMVVGQLEDMPVFAELSTDPQFSFEQIDMPLSGRFSVGRLQTEFQLGYRPQHEPWLAGNIVLDLDALGGVTMATTLAAYSTSVHLSDVALSSLLGELRGELATMHTDVGEVATITIQSDVLRGDAFAELAALWEREFPARQTAQGVDWLDLDFSLFRRWLVVPGLDFDIQVADIGGLEVPVSELHWRGRLSQGRIDEAAIEFRFGESVVRGEAQADFTKRDVVAQLSAEIVDFDLGQWLRRAGVGAALDVSMSELRLGVNAKGQNVGAFLDSAVVSLTANRGHLSVGATDSAQRVGLDLNETNVVMQPERQVVAHSEVVFRGQSYTAMLRLPSVGTLLRLDGQDLHGELALKNELGSINSRFSVPFPMSENVELDLHAAGSSIKDLGYAVNYRRANLGPYELKGQLRATPDNIVFDAASIAVGTTRLGPVSLDIQRGEDASVAVDVAGQRLNIDDFWQRLDKPEGGASSTESEAWPDSFEDAIEALVGETLSELSQQSDLAIQLEVEEIWWRGVDFGAGAGSATLSEHGLAIEQLLIGDEAGRSIDLAWDLLNQNDQVIFDVDVSWHGGDLDKLVPNATGIVDAEPLGRGYIYADIDLEGAAADYSGMLESLAGTVDLFVEHQGLDASALDIWVSNLLFAVLPNFNRKRSTFNCLAGRFDVNEGVLSTENLLLDSTLMLIHGRGQFDLAEGRLDVGLAPQSKQTRFFAIETPVSIRGNLPDYDIDIGAKDMAFSMFRLYYNAFYVPFQKMRGRIAPENGIGVCLRVMGWENPADRPLGLRGIVVDFDQIQNTR